VRKLLASLRERQGAADSDPRRIRVALAFPTLRIFKRRSGIRVMPLKAMTFGPDLGLTVDFLHLASLLSTARQIIQPGLIGADLLVTP
jgi:hypothetical protein